MIFRFKETGLEGLFVWHLVEEAKYNSINYEETMFCTETRCKYNNLLLNKYIINEFLIYLFLTNEKVF